jgi:hypothetical protein
VERRLVFRKRSGTAPDARPGGLRIDLDEHRQRPLFQRLADGRRLDRAAPEREDRRPLVAQRLDGCLPFEQTELRLAALLEQLRNRLLHRPLELPVQVDEATAELLRRHHAERRLASAHEADERDVPV